MSAVAQRARSRPATLRSQSVGLRPPGRGHADLALHRGDARADRGEVGGQLGAPAALGHDVVVEERDPLGPARAPAQVAGRRRPARAAAHHAGQRPQRARGRRPRSRRARRRAGRRRAPPAPGSGPRPHASASSSVASDGRPEVGMTTSYAHAARRSPVREGAPRRSGPAHDEGPDRQRVDRRGAEALQRVARVVDHRPARRC